jgi:hypothetical protein
MQNQLLLIHVANKNKSSFQDEDMMNMLVEKDYEMLNSLSKDKKIQKSIKNKELSIIIINQNDIH